MSDVGDYLKFGPGQTAKLDTRRAAFSPKEDITTWELARVLAYMRLTLPGWHFDVLPDDVKRHFLVSDQ